MRKTVNTFRIPVGNPEGKTLCGRRGGEDIIKIDLTG
jgi:hypothetical protein